MLLCLFRSGGPLVPPSLPALPNTRTLQVSQPGAITLQADSAGATKLQASQPGAVTLST